MHRGRVHEDHRQQLVDVHVGGRGQAEERVYAAPDDVDRAARGRGTSGGREECV